MEGWIALHRQIMESWIWEDPKRLKWWVTILMTVSHKPSQVYTNQGKHSIQPGESFRSIESWTGLFGCSKRTTIKFFIVLEQEDMIRRTILGKGNRRKHLISVVKWNDYQMKGYPKVNPKVNPNSTSNNNGNKNLGGNTEGSIVEESRGFYLEQIGKAEASQAVLTLKYKTFVDYLFKTNDTGQPLISVLSLPSQISYQNFEKLMEKHDGDSRLMKEKLLAMSNTPALTRKYKSAHLTLDSWMSNKSKSKTG